MSATTFTLRDLNRKPAAVLKACDAEGSVKIRTRAGKTYVMQLDEQPLKKGVIPDFTARRRRMRELGVVMPTTQEGWDKFDRIIAGEE